MYRRVVQFRLAAEIGVDHAAHGGGPVREAPQLHWRLRSLKGLARDPASTKMLAIHPEGRLLAGQATAALRTPLADRCSTRSLHCVLFPHRSPPSNRINAPRGRAASDPMLRHSNGDRRRCVLQI